MKCCCLCQKEGNHETIVFIGLECAICDECRSDGKRKINKARDKKTIFPPKIVELETSKDPSDNPLFGLHGISTNTNN